MKDKCFIVIVISYAATLIFELGGNGIRRDWFLGTDLVYPDIPKIWGYMAGKHALTLQYYLDGLGDHLHVLGLYIYIFINTRQDKPHFFFLAIFFGLSLLNYIYNNHEPLVWKFDMNYPIIVWMIYMLASRYKHWFRW